MNAGTDIVIGSETAASDIAGGPCIVIIVRQGKSFVAVRTLEFAEAGECNAAWQAMRSSSSPPDDRTPFFAWKCPQGRRANGHVDLQSIVPISIDELVRHMGGLSLDQILLRCRIATTTSNALTNAMCRIAALPI